MANTINDQQRLVWVAALALANNAPGWTMNDLENEYYRVKLGLTIAQAAAKSLNELRMTYWGTVSAKVTQQDREKDYLATKLGISAAVVAATDTDTYRYQWFATNPVAP